MPSPRRILFVVPFNHDHGTERIMHHVISGACVQFHKVGLLYSGGRGELFRDISHKVDSLFWLGRQDRRGNIHRNALNILFRILTWRPDVICMVSHVMGQSGGLALSWIPRKRRPFSVLSHHDDPVQRVDPVEQHRMRRWFRHFDVHVVVSGSMTRSLRPYVGEGRIECIPNGIDVDAVLRASRCAINEPAPLPPHRWRCVCVGGLRPDRRVDRLIRAFSILPEYEETVLLLVGDGEYREQLEALARELGVSKRCIFVGFQANPHAWLRHCDLFVQTPKWETFGLALLEAMAIGVPVLSMGDESHGLRDFIRDGENGRLIESGDVEEFASAWSALLHDEDARIQMGKKGMQTARCYPVEKMVGRYLTLFGQGEIR